MIYADDLEMLRHVIETNGYKSENRHKTVMVESIGHLFVFDPAEFFADLEQGLPKGFRLNITFAEQLAENIWQGNDGEKLDTTNWSDNQLSFLNVPPDAIGEVCATYGPKFRSQYEAIRDAGELNKPSRRANIIICTPDDFAIIERKELSNLEYPCTQSYQLLYRDGLLHMHVHMRSQNIALLPLDNYIQAYLLGKICEELGYNAGYITISFGSLHYFGEQ